MPPICIYLQIKAVYREKSVHSSNLRRKKFKTEASPGKVMLTVLMDAKGMVC